MLVAIAENGERDNGVFRKQGALPASETTAQLTLFSAPEDDGNELN
jgi:hypothetical protein